MKSIQVIFCFAAVAGIASAASYGSYLTQSQINGGGMARNTVPDTVSSCYRNQTAYNRFTRQPMHIENLIAIIRKIEQKTFNQWDMTRISRSILNHFQFDGMRHQPNYQQEFQFEPTSDETAKTTLVKQLIPGNDPLPEGLLDNDERCALHWMLSTSLNATMRDEEMSEMRHSRNLRAKRWVSETEEVEETSEEVADKSAENNTLEVSEAKDEAEGPISQNQPSSPVEKPEETKQQPAEETEQQSAEETEQQPAEETKQQPAEETEQQPAEKTEQQPAEKTEQQPAEETEQQSAEKTEQQSVEESKTQPENQPNETQQQPELTNEQPEEIQKQPEGNNEAPKNVSSNDVSKENFIPQTSNTDPQSVPSKTEETEDNNSEEVSENKEASDKKTSSESKDKSSEKSAPAGTDDESASKTVETEESSAEKEQSEEKPQSDEDTAGKLLQGKLLQKPDDSAPAPAPGQEPSKDSSDKKASGENVASPPSPEQSQLLDLPHDGDDDETEIMDGYQGQDSGSKSAQQIAAGKTRMPIETGVVYTKWGAVSAARVIAGIAAGLEPMSLTTSGYVQPSQGNSFGSGGRSPNNPSPDFGNGNPNTGNANSNYYGNSRPQQNWSGRKRRQLPDMSFVPLENVFAGTLAGDIGQAAILNAKSALTSGQRPPYGAFNNSICPREYVLEPLPNPSHNIYDPTHSWSYMTEAEIRGGVDGLILGSKVRDWNAGNNMKLSDLLESYYSEQGVSGDPTFRSCDRSSLYNAIDASKVREQSRTFAWIYGNRTSKGVSSTDAIGLEKLVNDAYAAASGAIGNFRSDRVCTRRVVSGGAVETDDSMKFTEPKTTIYAVIDQTATRDEIWQQQLFLGQLVADIDISPRGSRLGLIDGSSGQIIISPNYTDNSAILSCDILGRDLQTRSEDKIRVLNSFQQEMNRLRDLERNTEYNIGQGNGITLLFFVQGKALEVSQQSEIRRLTNDLAEEFGDVHIMYTSNKVQRNDLKEFTQDPEYDFIPLQGGNITGSTENFLSEYLKRNHGRLYYPRCNANMYEQNEEQNQAVDILLTANSIQYYKISADYFYSAKNLRLRFTSNNGKARICSARNEKFPNSKNAGQNGVECKETSGNYVPPGSNTQDVEFGFGKPCGKHGKRSGCTPIYISVTPTTQPISTGGLQCSPDGTCESTNKVKVTFTHWDMRCNSGIRTMISSPVALITALTSLFMWFKST